MRRRVEELFHRVADLSPSERARHLANDPGGTDTVREVEELLAHDDEDGDSLSAPIAGAAALALLRLDAVGARCGAFRLVSVIGRGGMGVVYLAERVDGEIHQRAAVKLLQPAWMEAHRERFLLEREILAALSHPNIAHLLDAGHLDDGQPYLAMEYVAGNPIDRYCEGKSTPQRIQLFLKVCGAVEYLHRNHLVHRDLKPSNILVNADGEPKLLDFGVSKMLDLTGDATVTCARLLTPNYASPEQVSGGSIGTASDIYSLGVVLNELLSGAPEGDLDVVVRTATRPDPEERYASVEQFAEDLRAVLESKPIRVRKADWTYRTRKLIARCPFTIAVSATAAAAVITAGAAVWASSRSVSSAVVTATRLTANTSELPISAAAISPDGKWIAYSDALGIYLRDTATGVTRSLPQTSGHVIARWMPDSASLLTTVQNGSSQNSMTVSLKGGAPMPASDAWVVSPDGRRRVMTPSGTQRIVAQKVDGTDSREIWRGGKGRALDDFGWSSNSEEVAIASWGDSFSTLEVIDVVRGRKSVLLADSRRFVIGGIVWIGPNRIVFSTVERAGANSYNSNLWEARLNARRELAAGGLRKLTAWTDFPIQPGSLTSDGRRLVFVRSFAQRDVYVARVDASRPRMEAPRRLTLDLGDDYPTAWTRDSKSVILTSDRAGDTKIFRQNIDRQEADALVDSPGSQILPRMAPDGRSVLFCSVVPKERTCRLMRAPLGGGKPELVETIPQIADFRCSAAGPCLVTQMQRQTPGHVVSELNLTEGKGREIYRDTDSSAGTPDLSPDGAFLATVSGTMIIVRSFSTGAIVRQIQVRGARRLATLDYAPDGKGFYTGEFLSTEARQLYVDLSGKTTLLWRQPGRSMIWGVPSPDGRNLALLMYTTDANVYMVDAF